MSLIGILKPFKAKRHGDVKGQSMIASRKDHLDIHAFHFRVTAPRDSATGGSVGRRAYTPIAFSSIVDASFPLLTSILDTNDTIESLDFQFFMPRLQGDVKHGGGREILTVEWKFTTVHLASVEFRQLNTLSPALARLEMAMTITAVFEKIDINYKNNANTSMTASWSQVELA